MRNAFATVLLMSSLTLTARAQAPDLKFIADTLVVQTEGTFEADPDLATMIFHIFSQEKELKKAYGEAMQSMQRISTLAAGNGLKKEDVSTGVLTVAPIYEGDRKKRARSYYVQGELVLHVHDFSKIGSILDGSVEDDVADFRSLEYSLSDEESAKQKAVADAMQRAIGRATIALEQKGQKLGGLRYMSLDVQHLFGVAQLQSYTVETSSAMVSNGGIFSHKQAAPPPPPPPSQPQRITVRASVQCAFQIQ